MFALSQDGVINHEKVYIKLYEIGSNEQNNLACPKLTFKNSCKLRKLIIANNSIKPNKENKTAHVGNLSVTSHLKILIYILVCIINKIISL